jgi:uncharacterized protein (TIGR03435 family)
MKTVVFLFFSVPLLAQTFEVASIKPSAPVNAMQVMTGQQRVGIKVDGARADIANLSLADLIRIAYRLRPYQIAGPEWMKAERFDILGSLPEGASPGQVPEMLQQLLRERFRLSLHRETKEHAVYALLVGKNGPRLLEAAPDAAPAVSGQGQNVIRISPDAANLMVSEERTGPIRVSMGAGNTMRLEAEQASMAALADILSRILDRPVVDMTALKASYRLTLNLSMQDMHAMVQSAGVVPPGPATGGGDTMHRPLPDAPGADAPAGSVFENIQQLGLKLEPRKAPMEMIVIDRLDKTPTGN